MCKNSLQKQQVIKNQQNAQALCKRSVKQKCVKVIEMNKENSKQFAPSEVTNVNRLAVCKCR